MPADRLITVNVDTGGTRNEHGEYTPGYTSYRTWASKYDLTLEDVTDQAGTRDVITRRWRCRFDSRIYDGQLALMQVVDEGRTFNVTQVREVTRQGRGRADLRRRYLDVTGASST